ncbi:hypothetical protein LCGC14_2267010 [marine sediment metagenome]|uniref:Viral late gene transcription factor 3 zinc ribbon domain-containing protein n=1 Tax=marine sediment metagenome TaxID=412755 RepID=A0A0F9DKD7_9ZZZZ
MGVSEGCQGHEDANKLIEKDCPKCSAVVEYYSHDKKVECPSCGADMLAEANK